MRTIYIYVHICVHIYTHIYFCIYTNTRTRTHTNSRLEHVFVVITPRQPRALAPRSVTAPQSVGNERVCVCVCVCVCACACVLVCVPAHARMVHSYVWHDTFMCVWHDAFIRVTWRIHMCDIKHSIIWHETFVNVTWPIHVSWWHIHTCHMTHSHTRRDSFICDDTTHLYAWHDSFARVTWLMHMCDMIHSYVWHDCAMTYHMSPKSQHDQLTCPTHIYIYDMTHSNGCHDVITCVTWHMHMCDVTHSYVMT